MTHGLAGLSAVAVLFGVLMGSAVRGPFWQQVGAGLASAVIGAGALRSGALLYDRLVASGNRRGRERERSP